MNHYEVDVSWAEIVYRHATVEVDAPNDIDAIAKAMDRVRRADPAHNPPGINAEIIRKVKAFES